MIDFDKEIKRFKPSTDVLDLETTLANTDLTDMRDISLMLLKDVNNNQN